MGEDPDPERPQIALGHAPHRPERPSAEDVLEGKEPQVDEGGDGERPEVAGQHAVVHPSTDHQWLGDLRCRGQQGGKHGQQSRPSQVLPIVGGSPQQRQRPLHLVLGTAEAGVHHEATPLSSSRVAARTAA